MAYNSGGNDGSYYNGSYNQSGGSYDQTGGSYDQSGYGYSSSYPPPGYDSGYYYGAGYDSYQGYTQTSYGANATAPAAGGTTAAAPTDTNTAGAAAYSQNQWSQYYPPQAPRGGRGGGRGGAVGAAPPTQGAVITTPQGGKEDWAPVSSTPAYSTGFVPRGRGGPPTGFRGNRGGGRGGRGHPGGQGGQGHTGGFQHNVAGDPGPEGKSFNNQPNYNNAPSNYNNAPPNYNNAPPNYNNAPPNYNIASPSPMGAQMNRGRGRGRGRGAVGAFNTQRFFSTLEEFFEKAFTGMHPTGWVSEQARRHDWLLTGKEGTEGTKYSYTLTITDLTAVGVATKKKEAKNFAFRTMSVRVAEKLLMIPKQSGDIDELINKALKIEPPEVVIPAASAPVDPAALDYNPTNQEIPKEIPQLNAEEVSSLPGKAVVLLNDELKRQGQAMPIFTCINEERPGKGSSNFGKTEFTFKVKMTVGNKTLSYFGKALNKKDAKNQAACFAFMGLMGKKIEDYSLKPASDPLLQEGKEAPMLIHCPQDATKNLSAQVAGAGPPPVKPPAQPVIKMAPRAVPAGGGPNIAASSVVPDNTTAAAATLPQQISIETKGVTKVVPVASVPPQVKVEVKADPAYSKNQGEEDKKAEESFDDSSLEFSTFMSKTDTEKGKERKRSRSRSRSRSKRSRSRSGGRSRSSSSERGSKYRKRSSSRDRYREKSRGWDSGYKSSYRSSSRDRYKGGRR